MQPYAQWIADGWMPVWSGNAKPLLDDNSRVWPIATCTESQGKAVNTSVAIKLVRDNELQFVIADAPIIAPPSLAPLIKSTADVPGSVIGIVPAITPQNIVRAAAIMGYGPLVRPGAGIGGEILRPRRFRIVGLGIEQTTKWRGGQFPLPSDPLVSICMVTNDNQRLCGYTVGYVDMARVKLDESYTVLKFNSSRELVDWVLQYLIDTVPDFVCIHNGFGFDIPRMAAHCSPQYRRYFTRVNLGAHDKGMDLDIPGVTFIDTWRYTQKLHGSEHEFTSLDALANELGIGGKAKAPPMDVDPYDDDYDCTEMLIYNAHDAYLHVRIADELQIIDEIAAIAALCKSPVSDASRFISGTLCANLSSSHAISQGHVMDFSPEPVNTRKYKGAYVVRPTPMFTSSVDVLDFKSLYPSIMIDAKISPENVVVMDDATEHYEQLVPDRARYMANGAVYWDNATLYAKVDDRVVVMNRTVNANQSAILRYLIDARRDGKVANGGKDTPLTYAMKIIANSMYGANGAQTSPVSSRYGAATVTSAGRWLLSLAIVIATRMGNRVLYGDTDSIFLARPDGTNVDVHAFMRVFHAILRHTAFRQVKFEYEKHYEALILVRPKMYYGKYYSKGKVVYETKGLSIKRRDRVLIARQLTEAVCRTICDYPRDVALRKVVELIFEVLTKVDADAYPIEACSYERKESGVRCYCYVDIYNNLVKHPTDKPIVNATMPSRVYLRKVILSALEPILTASEYPSVDDMLRAHLNGWYERD